MQERPPQALRRRLPALAPVTLKTREQRGSSVAGRAWERCNSFPPGPTGQVNRKRAVQATRGPQRPRPKIHGDWLDAGCDHGQHGLGVWPPCIQAWPPQTRWVGARVHSRHQREKPSVSSPPHAWAHTLNPTLRSTGHATLTAWSRVWPSSHSMNRDNGASTLQGGRGLWVPGKV